MNATIDIPATSDNSPQLGEIESVRPVIEVFLDEAGYTGPDLANRDQPVFVLASTVVTAEQSRALLANHFASDRDGEIKHARLAKTSVGGPSCCVSSRRFYEHRRRPVFSVSTRSSSYLRY